MRSTVRRLVESACACALALGCASNDDAADTEPQTATCAANVVASDASNYAFSSTITLSPVPVAPMSNLRFDWSGLTRDFMGHELAPAQDLDLAMVMFWDLPLAEFEAQLNA